MHDRPRKRDHSRRGSNGSSGFGGNRFDEEEDQYGNADESGSGYGGTDGYRRPRRHKPGLMDRLFPSMMRSASFWITAGLILGIYMVAFLFFKDMVIIPAPAVPNGGETKVGYFRRVLDGFYGKYEERVVEQRADGTVIIEQRYTVPTALREVSPMSKRATNAPAAAKPATPPITGATNIVTPPPPPATAPANP